jgi:outer membrane protein assembly factor BamA
VRTSTPAIGVRIPTSLVLGLLLAAGLLGGPAARGQEPQPGEGMLIKRVEIVGLETISEAYVRRVIKTREAQPFQRRQVEEDVRELLRSRRFLNVFATTAVEEDQAVVIFTVQEKPEILTVELEGNKRFSDSTLFALTPAAGDALDAYDIRRGREEIIRKYKEAGYYYVQVELDERAVLDEGRVVYRINEGPRVRVRQISLAGNRSFPDWRLRPRIRTRTAWWFLRTGAFDEEVADRDALELQRFYRDEGYLDVRVGYRLEFDEVTRSDLHLVFVIEEGERYRINDIVVEGNSAFSAEQIRGVMGLEPGNVLRDEALTMDRRGAGLVRGDRLRRCGGRGRPPVSGAARAGDAALPDPREQAVTLRADHNSREPAHEGRSRPSGTRLPSGGAVQHGRRAGGRAAPVGDRPGQPGADYAPGRYGRVA